MANLQLAFSAQGYFDVRTDANPLVHLWTLSVEEQVYLVVPLLLIGAFRLGRDRRDRDRVVLATVATTAVASFALAVVLGRALLPGLGDTAVRFAFYSSPTRAWEFLAGSLLALAAPVLSRRARTWAAGIGVVVLAGAVLTFDGATAFPEVAALVPVVATVLLLAAGTGDGTAVGAALSTGPARWVGDRSYSWYLWHWPLIVFAASTFPGSTWAPVAAGFLALVPAAASYTWVEQPIRRPKVTRYRPTLALGAACVLLPLIVIPVGSAAAGRLDSAAAVGALEEDMRPHTDQTRRCNDSLADTASRDACTWTVARPRGTALLVGDSNAGMLSEPFLAAARDQRLDATIQTRAACPFADLVVRKAGRIDQRCRAFYEAQVAAIEADPPDVVVIAAAGDLLMDKPEVTLAATADRRGREDPLQVWEDGLARTLGRLARAEVGLVVVHPVPRFTGWQSPAECAWARVVVDVDGCSDTRESTAGGPVAQAEERALDRSPGVVGVELGPALCPDGPCATRRDEVWLWKDESHLSVDGALSIEPELAAAMAEVGPGPRGP